ncbi:MAG: tRNA dihydrouridine(20/20a) synthase DusA [Gemmobacter sp.]
MTYKQPYRLAIAPMMDWTDRHCRAFHRLMSREVTLYTEMVTAQAIVHGDPARLLAHDAGEGPVVLQLGGSDPEMLARAARIGVAHGYDAIDLNCGCPSDRVQSGAFGAVLMRDPALVAACVAALREAVAVPVSVKCRLGVDEQRVEETLPRFLETLRAAGLRAVTIHARKAWLEGLSPRENREIPPLDPALARAMITAFPDLAITLNGGITTLEGVRAALAQGFAGVMVGRAAYNDPAAILLAADAEIYGQPAPFAGPAEVARAMRAQVARHIEAGGRMHAITRHMLGLFHGRPGARTWRRLLSEGASGGLAAYDAALDAVGATPEAAGAHGAGQGA